MFIQILIKTSRYDHRSASRNRATVHSLSNGWPNDKKSKLIIISALIPSSLLIVFGYQANMYLISAPLLLYKQYSSVQFKNKTV